MSLHGTLETFALPDVMALLAATKKSGELRVVGGKLDGRVHIDDGRVIAANVGRADSFVDAVFELLRLSTGKFSFDNDAEAENPSDPVEIEPLLIEAQARLTEWRGIEAVVPSMDHGVVLVKELGDPHVTLASEQWRMVVAVAGASCVSHVADRLGLGEFSVCKALKELVESGVVEVTDPPAQPEPKPQPKAEAKPDAKAEAKPEPKADAKPEPKQEPKAEAKAEAQPEPKADATVDAADKSKGAPSADQADKRPVTIEPALKPDAVPAERVTIPALTTTDTTGPAAPGDEPRAKADKPVETPADKAGDKQAEKPAAKPAVDPVQAKQLVSQLAALGGDKPKADEAPEGDGSSGGGTPAKGDSPAAKAQKPEDEAGAQAAPGVTEGGEGEEPLNRGLLLKFLSSVRQ